ncbi:rRNA 2'-O-methyltransferase fibrillarin-like [Panicum hallii]|uniref:rRNA 2'-O-methyltransferase fibrillarin-like n=1 Tax=Panicum hallii TaxID=206008 RepID=UPI000DF4D917|nr:rRNA 2'-O-methyltransferase fibrillarin-like [Panicum hallii]
MTHARFNFYPRCPRPDLVLGLKPHSATSCSDLASEDASAGGGGGAGAVEGWGGERGGDVRPSRGREGGASALGGSGGGGCGGGGVGKANTAPNQDESSLSVTISKAAASAATAPAFLPRAATTTSARQMGHRGQRS